MIAPGAHIELRDAVWRVVSVDQTSSQHSAWRCIGVSEIVRDQEAVFLEEFEPKLRVLDPRETRLEQDLSSHHRAGLLYIESLLRDVPPPDDGLYVGPLAAMDLLQYQLDPAWQALQRPRQRILIADAPGLGKTLETGILLSELIRRGRGRRILVATVQSNLTQFQKEMWCRFSIPLVRLDSAGLQRIRADLPTHHNPFHHFDRVIISIDTLKQNNWFRTHLERSYWDIIVVDEAHNVATRGSSQSMRARIADLLATRCDSLILVSATPHDGKARSFASLMNMLDPTAIADPDDYTKEDIGGLYVRRFKGDVAEELGKRIPDRRINTAWASASLAEERAFETLASLSLSRVDKYHTGELLFKTTIEKELFSSPAACLSTIRNRIQRIGKREDADDFAQDVKALEALAEYVRAVHEDAGAFSKYGKLLELIRHTWKWNPRKAKDDRIVIFTERLETLAFLETHLAHDLGLEEGQWHTLDGSMSDIEQQEVVEAFGKEKDPIRLLLATDVAAEGLNLHYLCHRLVHFDVPWSLMKFQQRNGRIDRYGQECEPHIVYMLTKTDHAAIRGDMRILELLIEKDTQANKNIGDPSAFMNVYDIDEEELITGRAIEAGQSAEKFEAELEARFVDPFAVMLGEATVSPRGKAPTRTLSSLFASDFDYLSMAAARLRETIKLECELRPNEKLAELRIPDDLRRRLRKLPAEAFPDDGTLLLTSDTARMQQALADARREENTWPVHQFLWPNSPILQWVGDRVRSEFGRHAAPVLTVNDGFNPGEVVVIVSGLLPNRRAQPLVHNWYAVRFEKNKVKEVEPFRSFLERTSFGRRDLPNAKNAVDIDALTQLLPMAVEVAGNKLEEDRRVFIERTAPRLREEKTRLERLRGRQLEFAERILGERTDSLATQKHDNKKLHIEKVFSAYEQWVVDAMTVGAAPFIQVVAVLVAQDGGRR
ncbi:MAG: DEAD/DEAH box helicase [Deltaproteobacteria bacterium]|nr:DEAD/DEAH box helicase [Deltaproteobacteria bacterium]